jgi:GNAT superfamily N-acetyltransferase
MSRITIRPATPNDVPLILTLIRELAEYEREPQAAIATPALIHDALFGPKPAAESVIGELDGQPQGFALFFHNFSTWQGKKGIYLEDLFVRPAVRGSGLGKALFSHVARLAVERGCARYEWSVLDWNEPAIGFYQKHGAVPMSEWTVFRLTGKKLLDLAANKPS